MKIIPVIDILNGIVVHAIKGRRSEYQPLRSALSDSSSPLAVALAFKACGFDELYIADLDAITGKNANLAVLKQISDETGLKLMVDAGVADLKKAEVLVMNHVSKVIIGTETLPRLSFVEEAIRLLGGDRVVVSLDLRDEAVIGGFESVKRMSPLALSREFQEIGVTQLIVLDLARVGSGEGVNMSILKDILNSLEIKVFVGGGVRDIQDLLELEKIGVFGVLLASALHSGRISLEEIRTNGFMG